MFQTTWFDKQPNINLLDFIFNFNSLTWIKSNKIARKSDQPVLKLNDGYLIIVNEQYVIKIYVATFSWHEIGVYDIPASIDYVLNVTGQNNLFYIGFSLGTTSYLAMGASKYYEKIRLALLMAPIAFLNHTLNPVYRALAFCKNALEVKTNS